MIATNTHTLESLITNLTELVRNGIDPLTPVRIRREAHANDSYEDAANVLRTRRKYNERTSMTTVEILTD